MRLGVALALFVLLSSFESFAQNDPKAKAILDKVSRTYKSFKTVQADFIISIENEVAQVSDRQTGLLYLKGENYRIETDGINRVTDGMSIWTHFIEEEEIQITEFDPEDEELTPAELFTIYEKDYICRYDKETTIGGYQYHQIDLAPMNEDNPNVKVKLTVNKYSNIIASAKVFGKNGTRFTYELKKFTPNKFIDEGLFTINTEELDESIEVIDLR